VTVLRAESLALQYGQTPALVDAALDVRGGEAVAVTGPSGSGKSTLLYCLAGLLRPDAGEVTFRGRSFADLSDDERSDLRRTSFGFVFQFAELVPELSLRENVALPLQLNGVGRRDRTHRVDELLDILGLAAAADRRPGQVSGGQAQRAAVARAVVHRPAVVFCDEPTGSLDSAAGAIVLDQLLRLAHDSGSAVVLVTHSEEVAAAADRRVEVRDGRTHVLDPRR
jgi:putative ABC transport system ATP-binding protein